MKKRTGFTLVEILIVVAIVTTLATLAFSNALRARLHANEANAVSSCRTIVTAAQGFYASTTPHTYPNSLAELALPVSTPPYIDTVLSNGTKQGYTFLYNQVNTQAFTLNANPVDPGRTGVRYFFVDQTGVIKANPNGVAGAGDPAIE